LVTELAGPWQTGVEGRRHEARGGARRQAAGAGARHRHRRDALPDTYRAIAGLVPDRTATT
ncbi:IS5/IS1182 family transposase, partial [Streptomyces sp. NPDC056069]